MSEFDKVVIETLESTKATLCSKAKEYASEKSRFHNFEVAAKVNQTTRKKALWGMATKHLVSVMDMIDTPDGHGYDYAHIQEKIGDMINYLVLLKGMLYEDNRSCPKQMSEEEFKKMQDMAMDRRNAVGNN